MTARQSYTILLAMDYQIYDSRQAAAQIGITLTNLQVWLMRHPEYRPQRRISGDDLLWLPEDVERVKQARERTKKHGQRKTTSLATEG